LILISFTDRFSFSQSGRFKFFFKILFWNFVFLVFFLGYLGQKPVEFPFIFLSQVSTFLYFSYFLCFLPFFNIIDLILKD
jgi:ubiquinol-cytochrome c reductase cytochrome b subunit